MAVDPSVGSKLARARSWPDPAAETPWPESYSRRRQEGRRYPVALQRIAARRNHSTSGGPLISDHGGMPRVSPG